MSQVIIEDEGWKLIMADPQLARARSKLSFHEIRLIVRHARAIEATRPTLVTDGLVQRVALPSGQQFIDEAALDRWRDTERKCGHDLAANNNTVWRLVATIDHYRTPIAAMPTVVTGEQPMQQQNQRAVGNDEPVMIAWKAYQQTDDYANSLSWTGKHSAGELWAAFSHGFAAAQPKVEG